VWQNVPNSAITTCRRDIPSSWSLCTPRTHRLKKRDVCRVFNCEMRPLNWCIWVYRYAVISVKTGGRMTPYFMVMQSFFFLGSLTLTDRDLSLSYVATSPWFSKHGTFQCSTLETSGILETCPVPRILVVYRKQFWMSSTCRTREEAANKEFHVMWVPVTTAQCVLQMRLWERLQDTEGSWEYIKQAIADSQKWVVSSLGLGGDWNLVTVKRNCMLQNVTQASGHGYYGTT